MKLKKTNKSFIRTVSMVLFMLTVFCIMAVPAFADGIEGSPIVEGTENLINDVTTWLMVLAPVVGGLLIIYFCIRRAAADEMDTKKWNNRIIVTIVSCIGAIIGSATLNIVLGYFG